MPSLEEFIESLQSGWRVALICLIGSSLVILGNRYQIDYLRDVPRYVIVAFTIAALFSFCIIAVSLLDIVIEIGKSAVEHLKKRKLKKEFVAQIGRSTPEEKYILSYLFSTGQRVFTASLIEQSLTTLRSKGFVVRDGGQHDITNWPHRINSLVWEYMESHEIEFLIDVNSVRHPFSRRY